MSLDHSSEKTFEAGVPAEEGDLILERRMRVAFELCPPEGERYLDFGCGNGAQTLRFVPNFRRCYGVDINAHSLELFRDAAVRRGHGERVETLLAGTTPLPLDDGSIDYLTSFEVLEHVRDEGATLAEWRRLLSPRGHLVVSVPNRWWIFETHGADLPWLPWNRVPFFSWLPTKIHDRWARARIYTRADIIALLESHGFVVESSSYVTAPMDVVRWGPLRQLLRATVFRGDRTALPALATSILLSARKA